MHCKLGNKKVGCRLVGCKAKNAQIPLVGLAVAIDLVAGKGEQVLRWMPRDRVGGGLRRYLVDELARLDIGLNFSNF